VLLFPRRRERELRKALKIKDFLQDFILFKIFKYISLANFKYLQNPRFGFYAVPSQEFNLFLLMFSKNYQKFSKIGFKLINLNLLT